MTEPHMGRRSSDFSYPSSPVWRYQKAACSRVVAEELAEKPHTLHQDMTEALNLLDTLIDPLLEMGPTKGRVVAWKLMARAILERHTEGDE